MCLVGNDLKVERILEDWVVYKAVNLPGLNYDETDVICRSSSFGFGYTEGVQPEIHLSLEPHVFGSFCDDDDTEKYNGKPGNLIVHEGYHFYLDAEKTKDWPGTTAEFIVPAGSVVITNSVGQGVASKIKFSKFC